MMVYVLTTYLKESKEHRPVAVVDEAHRDAAEQWARASKNNDFVPLEMNDMSLTDTGEMPMTFKPLPVSERGESTLKSLEKTNATLIGIIEQLATRYKDKDIMKIVQKLREEGKVARFTNELLRKNDD